MGQENLPIGAKILVGAVAALSLCSLSSRASAEVEVFTGIVTSDSELNALGVSGSGVNTYVGQMVTMTVTFDRANGIYSAAPDEYSETIGGSYYGVASPISSEVLQIGGISSSGIASYIGQVSNTSPAWFDDGVQGAYYETSVVTGGSYYYQDGQVSVAGLGVPQFGNGTGTGSLSFYNGVYNYATGATAYSSVDAAITSVSDVPETPAWLMMALGFAGLGSTGYRRSRKTQARYTPAF